MKECLKTANIRGSIFVPKVAYNTVNLDKMRTAFPDFMPTVLSPMAIPDVIYAVGAMNNNAWRLISPDQMATISFYDDKIDIIINKEAMPYSEIEIAKCSSQFFELFKKIYDAFGFSSIRLALAPTLFLPFTEDAPFTVTDFTKRIYSFNQFQGSSVDNCDFSQVFRVNRQLNNKNYLINHLTKFSTEFFQEQKGDTIHTGQRMTISMDINTFVNPQYKFEEKEMYDFYDQSPKWCEELIHSYFNEI